VPLLAITDMATAAIGWNFPIHAAVVAQKKLFIMENSILFHYLSRFLKIYSGNFQLA
jgi:hypothetical protein